MALRRAVFSAFDTLDDDDLNEDITVHLPSWIKGIAKIDGFVVVENALYGKEEGCLFLTPSGKTVALELGGITSL